MPYQKLLVANRGEIAIRVARAAAELGIPTLAIHSEDDARSLHVQRADEARALKGRGPLAYLDAEQIVAIAREAGCDAIHPGYGFLSENAAFAARCADAGLTFVGPRPETLATLGDKIRARALARELGIPVLPGSAALESFEQLQAFWAELGAGAALLIKAAHGGGGRGLRVVREQAELADAYQRCRSEAAAAFGDDAVYCERFIERARHVEVQILGDGSGDVAELGLRECSVQRQHQKLIEIAPVPGLSTQLAERLQSAALELARAVRYRGVGTCEFLLDTRRGDEPVFIEANPRLQVEHTVTELVTGVDLVQTQLQLAAGKSLGELGLSRASRPPRGYAIQLRVNMETMDESGKSRPSGGVLSMFEPPSGPGVRVDSFGYAGYATSAAYDSLLAKLIVHGADFGVALTRARRALRELRIEGVATNAGFLRALLEREELASGGIYTRFIEEHAAELFAASGGNGRSAPALAGARVDSSDPLAVLAHGKSALEVVAPAASEPDVPEGLCAVRAPMLGTIVSLAIERGQSVSSGQALLVMEAMKMESVIHAAESGVVTQLSVAPGDTVYAGHVLLLIEPGEVAASGPAQTASVDLDAVRPDLAEVQARHAYGLDARRPEAIAKRHALGRRSARENLAELVDPGSFHEYGALAIAAQRRRRPVQELIERTPADGLIGGVASVNGALFGDEARTQCIVVSYDYTVLAGTQGIQNHRKKDRLFELAEHSRLPVVLFGEGGGGRPGDSDGLGFTGLDCMAFALFGKLSGLVPLVGIASGRCFAGNAALLGCCDVVIATPDTNLGMGGPAMIEGGGLGVYRPEQIGPRDVQLKNGVVDIAVRDDAEAVRVARQYLSYFQGPLPKWTHADQRRLRAIIPENRKRIYDVRQVIETLADSDSVLELRSQFGLGMVTALARVEGRPLGIIANNPGHLAGAIDSQAADKAARFMQLCDAFDLPILFLCDTPGIMVGPEAEQTALVRHAARMFVTSASLSVPFFTIVLRKGYGLGAQLMAGGSFKVPFFLVAWPTGEFGGMGLEGAVKLGFRKELEAIADPVQRKDVFDKMVAAAYDHGKAVNVASAFEFDEVIDPAESRSWVLSALKSAPAPAARSGKKRPCVDTW
ncbi:MAG TPA: carboxyl transferase domain-containing protein [Polyangiales bacterium]|nr:carboxyl transferase domain-containing protein [Polyangiales bacterium]